jgi:hypothetical protein
VRVIAAAHGVSEKKPLATYRKPPLDQAVIARVIDLTSGPRAEEAGPRRRLASWASLFDLTKLVPLDVVCCTAS